MDATMATTLTISLSGPSIKQIRDAVPMAIVIIPASLQTLAQGSGYVLTVSTNNNFDYVSMWIDFNDDYNFDDSEKVVTDLLCSDPYIPYSASFAISPLATLGDHRMRLRTVEFTTGFDACSIYNYGEVQDYTAEIEPATDMAYVSSTTTQTGSDSVSLGSTDVEIIGIQVVTSGSLSPISATSFVLNNNGSTDPNDITNYKIYYTDADPNFATANLFGSSTDLSTPITGNQQLASGLNYFWLAEDISPAAPLGDYPRCGVYAGYGRWLELHTDHYGFLQEILS